MAKHRLRVGLTGGIASGKSTVAKLMRNLGCLVTDADRLVADLYQPHALGSNAVAAAFGPSFLDSEGRVDTHKLAEKVFADSDSRKKLELLIHPLVTQRFQQISKSESGIIVFEATLLVEGNGYRNFDRLITVEADPDLRKRRAVLRGLSESEAKARIRAQATEPQRVAVADFVIRNEGTLDQLRQATERVVRELEQELREPDSGSRPKLATQSPDDQFDP